MEGLFIAILFLVIGAVQAMAKKKRAEERDVPSDAFDKGTPDVLAELRKAMEQLKEQRADSPGRPQSIGAGPKPRFAPTQVEEFEDEANPEETESLETEPVVISLEDAPRRKLRPLIDQDSGAEAVVARRLQWADAHRGPLTAADHRAFDAKVRAARDELMPVIDVAAEQRVRRLRQMMVWKEILGKPIALRGDRW